jgi:hypothetical protein
MAIGRLRAGEREHCSGHDVVAASRIGVAHVSDLEALDDRATEGSIRVVDVHLHGGLGQAVAREPLAAQVQVDGVPTD